MDNNNLTCEMAINLVEQVLKRVEQGNVTTDDILTLINDIERYRSIDGFDYEIAKRHGPVKALIIQLRNHIH
jgi:hypothetical protein